MHISGLDLSEQLLIENDVSICKQAVAPQAETLDSLLRVPTTLLYLLDDMLQETAEPTEPVIQARAISHPG